MKCASNAKAYAATEPVVGVIGPWNSPCAYFQIPIASGAPEALALVSPSASHPEFTHSGPEADPNEPDVYYPTGVRSFFRVSGGSDLDGSAGAVLADELGLERMYVLRSTGGIGEETTTPFKRTARRLGIAIAGSAALGPERERPTARSLRVSPPRVRTASSSATGCSRTEAPS